MGRTVWPARASAEVRTECLSERGILALAIFQENVRMEALAEEVGFEPAVRF
jgi:hypothetical protein